MPRATSSPAAPAANAAAPTPAPADPRPKAAKKAKAAGAPAAAPARSAPGKRAASNGATRAKPAANKPAKSKPAAAARVKLVRDSFTMPEADFELIGKLKQRALKQGREVKKSELLRAGLHVLAATGDAAFGTAVAAVPRLKTGRPHAKKDK